MEAAAEAAEEAAQAGQVAGRERQKSGRGRVQALDELLERPKVEARAAAHARCLPTCAKRAHLGARHRAEGGGAVGAEALVDAVAPVVVEVRRVVARGGLAEHDEQSQRGLYPREHLGQVDGRDGTRLATHADARVR